MKLTVHRAQQEDVYRDFARISKDYRRDTTGKLIPEGDVCKIVAGGRTALVIARGDLNGTDPPRICLDERTRETLGVKEGETHDFQLSRPGLLGRFRWYWNASDPAYRISARVALLSLGIGVVALLLGLIALAVAFWAE
jgi:hypothetical protein